MYPLPAAAFDLVVVTRYLQRDLLPSLRAAVKPGGYVVYETFTVLQRALGTGPTSPDHLLEPGELRGFFDGWDVVFSEEVAAPEALARIVARKRAAEVVQAFTPVRRAFSASNSSRGSVALPTWIGAPGSAW